MVDGARRGDHQVAGGVYPFEGLTQNGGVERGDGRRHAENWPAQRMARPESLSEQLVDEIVGCVLHHLDLFKHYPLFFLDVISGKRGIAQQIGQHVDCPRQVLVEHLHVITGAFLGGERVELPAERIDLLGNVLGAPARGALEQHVLDEVRDSRTPGALVP